MKKLTVTGTINNIGGTSGLVIHSDTTGTGSLIHNNAGVAATVERYMIGNRWHVATAPLTGQNINGFITDASNYIPTSGANYGMMDYNEATNRWQYITAASTGDLTVGEGYLLRNTMDTVVRTYGALNSAQVDVAVTRDLYGWNSLGNPFPSSIGVREDATTTDNFLTYNATEFDPSFAVLYIWDEPASRNPNHSYWKVIGNSGFSSTKPILDQAYLQPGQGFLVRAKTGGGTMSFTQNMRVHESTTSFLKSAREPWPGINLKVSNESETASTAITFHAGMTCGLDVTYDAGLFGGNPNFSLYSHLVEDNGVNFMLQCLPDTGFENMIIPLGLDYKGGGLVTFTASTVGLEDLCGVILEDRLFEEFIDLSDEFSSYSTSIDTNSSGIGRFYLHIYNIPNDPVDPTDPTDPTDPMDPTNPANPVGITNTYNTSLNIYSYQGEIFVKGEIANNSHAEVFDLTGRVIRSYELIYSDINILPAGDIPQGIYIVHVSGQNLNATKQIILNQ